MRRQVHYLLDNDGLTKPVAHRCNYSVLPHTDSFYLITALIFQYANFHLEPTQFTYFPNAAITFEISMPEVIKI